MKKLVFYLPFIIFLVIKLLTISIGSTNISFYIILVAFLIGGILLSYRKIMGGAIGILSSIYILYMGMQNWKLGTIEVYTSIILLLFYSVCITYVAYKNKRRCEM